MWWRRYLARLAVVGAVALVTNAAVTGAHLVTVAAEPRFLTDTHKGWRARGSGDELQGAVRDGFMKPGVAAVAKGKVRCFSESLCGMWWDMPGGIRGQR